MNIKSQFLLTCISRAINAAEEVLSLFEEKYPKDGRLRKAIHFAKQWRTLMQQGKEAQARQMEQQLRDAACAATYASCAPLAAVNASYAAAAAAADAVAYAAACASDAANAASCAASAIAYAEVAKGNDWSKAQKAERQRQDEEAARLIDAAKGEILWSEGKATFLLGKINLRMRENNIQMIKAREILL